MKLFDDFKKFALKGNALDLAVGVIIGAAFGKIVSSLVTNILMPPIGILIGGHSFSNLFINLSPTPATSLAEAQKLNLPIIAYGLFLENIIDFLIIAFAIFILIKQINKLMPAPPPKPAPFLCPFCKTEIDKEATRCPHCTSHLTNPLA